ncbi:inositol-pentakisphosphate 2-kinase [Bactrocera neohumeralis]|uniref:inositol-pentakisphosphate 2-kinase n=1 Tax=Bactrocera neohumeralis TaxID=98809 RepID=UPI0021666DBA|nr:inositol-pentakisphosphate 2-kinase [Bactrocera neohumeralis]XP_050325394.1 inositol-pentakisphosphate 2-kinase [Bactrocera neohumeralis]XP_050325395.1 inositol-pentakisphosphate 2-kinase [Bactrocera neohumeralis]XP_050325396.1 inositol-pentakisphosphate 2-kinase [Bactrocera neohumeralis]XP_050325397.1 inositol-pentakisphosphate 2-kinase [Bactrocera neohumeralis]XP_050325398.1 inositol-pentakisphosphate 2-kinase [Bactrocera neohumeralis]XP_050325399.1 inositol-pentakisphosphate 2-kinase [B
MAANTNIATTDINKQGEQPRDSTRMAFVAASPALAPSSTSASPQQKRHQEQCSTKILQALLGIAAQPQGETQSDEPESVATLKQQWHMELSQIELIYRAEGNANLVLALPQFKKVLRLPKTSRLPTTSHSNSSKYNEMKIGNTQQQTDANVAKGRQVPDKEWQQHQQHQQQQTQQRQTQEMQLQHQPEQQKHQEVVQSASDPAVNQNAKDLTMEDFVAYIEVIRKLLGSEFVFETEIVRITAEKDIRWINERIRADRPAYRRDKEFCGEFGLLLPDATRLPIAFDILLSNLQAELIGDTYAIEIKPKQGWLLPTEVVSNLCELKKGPALATATAAAAAEQRQEAKGAEQVEGMEAPARSHVARCRFCAMQFLKLHTGKINRRTSYCPLALFSGVPAQMVTAIDALLRCPQNNLRIFRNGILVYDGEKHCYEDLAQTIFPGQIELLKDLVVACLLRDYTANDNSSDGAGGGEGSSSSVATNDEPADIVEVAKAASGQPHLSAASEQSAMAEEKQRADEMWRTTEESSVMPAHLTDSARGATEPAARVASRGAPTPPRPRTKTTTRTDTVALETTSQAQITEVETLCLPANCVLQKILHLQLLAKHHMPALHAAGYARKSEKSYNALKALLQHSCQQQIGDALQPVEAYMLGATALDCSVMVAFQEISTHNTELAHPRSPEMTTATALPRHCVVLPRYKRTFLTKVTLVDLDPKPDSHLCKYIKQTSQALNLFMDSSS